MTRGRFWLGFFVVVAGRCSSAWCGWRACEVDGGGDARGRSRRVERGMGKRLEGDDAVHPKTGLIFVRPLQFESVTFFGKLFQPIKSQDLIGRIFDVQ